MQYMKKFKALFAFLLALTLIIPVTVSADEVESNEDLRLNYVALGDSLAAGINEKGELANGYADYFALSLKEIEGLKSYNKGFAVPGYKTTDLLNDLKNNVTKPIFNLEGTQKETTNIQTAIKEADIITISIGANDVLSFVKPDKETGKINIDMAAITAGIKTVGENYYAILSTIKQINPDVEIFVMGYYNPYPKLENYKQQLSLLVTSLDAAISDIATKNGAHFVKVSEAIAADEAKYIPNPENIHLSAEGYQVVGLRFFETLASLAEEKVVFTDIEGHWAAQYIQEVVAAGIMSGYEDGTFKPDQALTRIETVSVITRSLELPDALDMPFVDVENYPNEVKMEVAKAASIGLVKGYNGYLKPDDKVTRAQLALMVSRAYTAVTGEAYAPEKKAPYSDIKKFDAETQNAITLLYDLGIDQGADGKFVPAQQVTRADAAKVIAGFLALQEK
ncbi:lysophospholipase L1-like esterase [Ureibacillus xyleni]|uniref:Lysophospholipase L1-like esterase n=1 Tax=Ureibacillus xyleni TaxID=614648 RepID=A0A285RVW5_9BACL|nr:S-layer homology domain-containing protein [Ureibacillus xyleni]SOB98670.1 lysophospholipase L1-like esterase [Ureibacillus xyleni]